MDRRRARRLRGVRRTSRRADRRGSARYCGPKTQRPGVSVSYTGDGDLREHLSAFRQLLALSMVMTDTADEDEIIRLATTAIPSLGPFRGAAVSLDGAWWPGATVRSTAPAVDLERQLESLDRAGERLDL